MFLFNWLNLFKKHILILGIILVVLGSVGLWIYSQFYVSTDDAYVNANVVQISARVTGQVKKLHVEDNQLIEKDVLLFEIDPEPFEIKVNQAKAQLENAKAKLEIAELTAKRVQKLTERQFKSVQENDTAETNLHAAQADVHRATANLAQAELDLTYTKVTAPTKGWVTRLTLREGNSVEANRPLFALVDHKEFWVDANFKETELQYIRLGQKADIVVDMYPNHHFKGIVDSISRGSGAAFSLLPPQNATGNWVKVTQRVPVKIMVKQLNPEYPLRIGTTATVKIHTSALPRLHREKKKPNPKKR